jgi:hypothetical protein
MAYQNAIGVPSIVGPVNFGVFGPDCSIPVTNGAVIGEIPSIPIVYEQEMCPLRSLDTVPQAGLDMSHSLPPDYDLIHSSTSTSTPLASMSEASCTNSEALELARSETTPLVHAHALLRQADPKNKKLPLPRISGQTARSVLCLLDKPRYSD